MLSTANLPGRQPASERFCGAAESDFATCPDLSCRRHWWLRHFLKPPPPSPRLQGRAVTCRRPARLEPHVVSRIEGDALIQPGLRQTPLTFDGAQRRSEGEGDSLVC